MKAAFVVGLLLGASLAGFLLPAQAPGLPPIVSWTQGVPKWPAKNETVNVTALVSDPEGDPLTVTLAYCRWPIGLCNFDAMTVVTWMGAPGDTAAGAIYNLTFEARYNPPSTVFWDYGVQASDGTNVTDIYQLDPFWLFPVDGLNGTAGIAPTTLYPSETLWASGTAWFVWSNFADTNGNGYWDAGEPWIREERNSLLDSGMEPAEGSSVTVQVLDSGGNPVGAPVTTTTDAAGNFSVALTAPAGVGSYTVNITVTNRSWSLTWTEALAVTAVPVPDLKLGPEDLAVLPASPVEDQEFTVRATVRNLGNAPANGVVVRFTGLLNEVQTVDVAAGGQTVVDVTALSAVPIAFTETVEVDPSKAIAESDESNNVAQILVTVFGDLDGDGVSDDTDPDEDGDGVSDLYDLFPRDPEEWADSSDFDGVGENADMDDDNDGLPDAWEIAHGLDPMSPPTNPDGPKDPDADGLTTLQEYELGTRFDRRDTDEDGLSDGEEVRLGTNPLDAASRGTDVMPWILASVLIVIGGAAVAFLVYRWRSRASEREPDVPEDDRKKS